MLAVESLTLYTKLKASPVQVIPQERKADVGKMNANLMGSTCMELYIHQMNIAPRLNNLIGCMGILARLGDNSCDNTIFWPPNRSNNIA